MSGYPVCEPCAPCETCRAALQYGALVWSPIMRAYIMPDLPWRRGRNGAQPYAFTTCPYCGGDLVTIRDGDE